MPTETAVKPQKFDPDELVTVLHGYGRVRPGERHYIDNVLFVNGVARNIPYQTAKQWTLKSPGTKIHILPNDADEPDYAAAAGIQLMTPQEVATMITASNLDEVYQALGPERALQLVQGLGQRLGGIAHNLGDAELTAPPPPKARR